MASKAPPPPSSRQPAGVPSGGGGKYVAVAVGLLGLVGAAVAWKTCQKPPEPTVLYIDAAPPPTFAGRNLDDDVPPPAPVEDAAPTTGKKPVATQTASSFGCDAKVCTGSSSPELETALQFRAQQSRRHCYDAALAQDPTLRGKVTIAVRVGSNGQVCSAGVASNEMSSPVVANCAAATFRGVSFPAPKGGCVDVNIPANFVPRQ